jgi:hypothetical protein
MAVSAQPRPGLREPAERRELEELARALDARPVPVRRLPERTSGRSQEPDTVEVSTFAAVRTSGVVAGLVVLAMTLALLFAGQALHLGWPATPLHAGGDGRDDSNPVTYALGAPRSVALGAMVPRSDQRRTGDHATSLRESRDDRPGREGRSGRQGGDRPSGSRRSGDGPRSGAPAPGSGPAPGRGGTGGDAGGAPVFPPGSLGTPGVEVPGVAPVATPRLPAGPIQP